MVLEWLRRRDPVLDRHLRTYLFTEGSLVAVEEAAEGHDEGSAPGDLGLGALPRRRPLPRPLPTPPRSHPVNHLLHELAPISDDAWSEIDRRGHAHADPLPRRPQARRLGRPARPRRLVGGRRAARVARPRWRATSPRPGVRSSRSSSCAARSRSTAPSSRPSTAARPTPTSTRSSTPAATWPAPRTSWCSTATPRPTIDGIGAASPHEPITLSDQFDRYPNHVAQAVAVLKAAGVAGPYAIALGPRCYAGVIETTEKGGYPLLQHLGLILGGPVVWAPAVDGAIVLSQRGDDFQLTLGQDTVDRLPQPRRRHRHPRAPGEPHLRARLPRGRHRPHLRLTARVAPHPQPVP